MCVNHKYTQLGRKKSWEKSWCDSSEEPHKWLRLAHPSKIAFSLQLGLRPQMMDRSISRVWAMRKPKDTERLSDMVNGVSRESTRIIEWSK